MVTRIAVGLGIACWAAFIYGDNQGGDNNQEKPRGQLVIKMWDRKNASGPVPIDISVHRSGLVTEGRKSVRVDDEYFKKILNRGLRDGKSYRVYICLGVIEPNSVLADKLLETLQRIRTLKDPDADVEVTLMADDYKPNSKPKEDESKDK